MKELIQTVLRRTGYQLQKYPRRDHVRRMKIVRHYNIDTLLDIGANKGQYALKMRALGYKKKIISFEPLRSAFEAMEQAARGDRNWRLENIALGDEDTTSRINIAQNSHSSSLAGMLPEHLNSAPESKYIGTEEIKVRKLDSILGSLCNEQDKVMIKIDTQGYEKKVLDGAVRSLDRILVVQLEMSIVPLYENEALYLEIIEFLDQKGFQLISLENGFSDSRTGELLQVDGIFGKKQ